MPVVVEELAVVPAKLIVVLLLAEIMVEFAPAARLKMNCASVVAEVLFVGPSRTTLLLNVIELTFRFAPVVTKLPLIPLNAAVSLEVVACPVLQFAPRVSRLLVSSSVPRPTQFRV